MIKQLDESGQTVLFYSVVILLVFLYKTSHLKCLANSINLCNRARKNSLSGSKQCKYTGRFLHPAQECPSGSPVQKACKAVYSGGLSGSQKGVLKISNPSFISAFLFTQQWYTTVARIHYNQERHQKLLTEDQIKIRNNSTSVRKSSIRDAVVYSDANYFELFAHNYKQTEKYSTLHTTD